ncbi:unnamed protein product [Musa acuminata subsp. malaccensis]|uniref:(wild Malaysian banana) hypothetical protein n=1 Tax=Musa acuminata subsp. malaccensis TaxID=214687 RepID=A0A804J288_MUSAM|nr:unnamed protein product [Musa acuminata subsp. malaccensis]
MVWITLCSDLQVRYVGCIFLSRWCVNFLGKNSSSEESNFKNSKVMK